MKDINYNVLISKKAKDTMLAVVRCYVETKGGLKAIDAYQSYLNKFSKGKYTAFAKNQIE